MPGLFSRRRPLSAASVAADFGKGSETAAEGVSALLYALNVAGDSPEVNAARRQWQEALQATFGSNVGRLERGLDALAASFQPAEGRDPLALLFAVQTYYVLIVKLLAWEVVAQARRSLLPSSSDPGRGRK